MKSRFHWKIIVAFIVTPILSFLFSGEILHLMLNSTDPPLPVAAFVFLGIFSLLGIWLTLTVIFRAKRITLTEKSLTISKLFSPKKYIYTKDDLDHYYITLRIENPYFDYEILQFVSQSGRHHSIVSYEFKDFPEIKKWFENSKIEQAEISFGTFLKAEYGKSFVVSLVCVMALIIWLKTR